MLAPWLRLLVLLDPLQMRWQSGCSKSRVAAVCLLSSEAAGMGQQCQRVSKGRSPPPPPPHAGRISWHPSVCPECCPYSVPGEQHRNPSSVSWLLLKDLGEFSGPRQAGALFHGQFLPLSGRVPQGALQDGVSAPAALPWCLGRVFWSLSGADVLYSLSCSKNPCLELWRGCFRMLLCDWIPGAAQGRLPGLALDAVNYPWSGRSLLGAGPCCSGGAP